MHRGWMGGWMGGGMWLWTLLAIVVVVLLVVLARKLSKKEPCAHDPLVTDEHTAQAHLGAHHRKRSSPIALRADEELMIVRSVCRILDRGSQVKESYRANTTISCSTTAGRVLPHS